MGTGGMARLHEKEAEAALDGKPRPQTGPRGRRSTLLIMLANLLTFGKPVSTVPIRLRPGPAPTGALRAAAARAVTTPFPPTCRQRAPRPHPLPYPMSPPFASLGDTYSVICAIALRSPGLTINVTRVGKWIEAAGLTQKGYRSFRTEIYRDLARHSDEWEQVKDPRAKRREANFRFTGGGATVDEAFVVEAGTTGWPALPDSEASIEPGQNRPALEGVIAAGVLGEKDPSTERHGLGTNPKGQESVLV